MKGEKRKILFINDFLHGGGAEVVLDQLVAGLEDSGFKTRLFYGAESNSSAAGNPLSYIYSFAFKRKLVSVLGDFQPDTVHLLNYYHILTPSILDALKEWKNENSGVKVIYTAHDFHLLCPNSGLTSFSPISGRIKREKPEKIKSLFKLWFKRWDHRGILFSTLKVAQWTAAYSLSDKDRVVDEIVCPGEFMFRNMKEAFPGKSVRLIRNPYPGSIVQKTDSKAEGRIKLVFIGRIAQEKGLVPFLKALSPQTWEHISFDIFGTGPQEKEVDRVIKSLPSSARCTLKGGQTHREIQELLPSYHLLILPSLWYENAPLSLAEAAFAGLRLAVSDWGGIKMMAEFLGGEYLFNPEEAVSVNKAVMKACLDIQNRVPLNRDYGKLESAFNPELFLQKHMELYLL